MQSLLLIGLLALNINMSNPNKENTSSKITIKSYEIIGDTIRITTDDIFMYYPFGDYATIADFKTHNTWTNIIPQKKTYILEDTPVYCFCSNKMSICFIVDHALQSKFDNAVATLGKYSWIENPNVILQHGIKVGITKTDFIDKFDLPKDAFENTNIVKLIGYDDLHFYYFVDDKLERIIFIQDQSQFDNFCN